MQCLECGQWLRYLGPHLKAKHAMTGREYREVHQLPRTLSLRSPELNERARDQGIRRFAERPDLRDAMAQGRTTPPETGAVASSRETATLPMVRAARRRGGQGKQSAERARIDQRAQAAGYASIEDYLAAHAETTISQMAADLGVARATVTRWKKQTDAGQDDLLTDLVAHLMAVAEGAEGSPAATAWRAHCPDLQRLEQLLLQPGPNEVLADAPRSLASRRGAYLAAVMTTGGHVDAATRQIGMSPKTPSAWREANPLWKDAEEAVIALARTTPTTPQGRRGEGTVPLTTSQIEEFLSLLRQGVPKQQAAIRCGRSLYAFEEHRRIHPEFAQAWNNARVLRGRPPKPRADTDR